MSRNEDSIIYFVIIVRANNIVRIIAKKIIIQIEITKIVTLRSRILTILLKLS